MAAEDVKKTELFEQTPIPQAVMTLAVPTMISSLVMVIYNLADTYFVGLLNDSVQTSAVTLGATVLLAFNAVNNLFGVGTSSMMSRAMGKKDFDLMERCSAVGFWLAVVCGVLFSVLYTLFRSPLLVILGARSETVSATGAYLFWTTTCGAAPAILNVVMANLIRSEGSSLHASIGTMSGCILNIILDPFFILPFGLNMGAAGAGCATFISNCIACLYFFILLFVRRGRTHVNISPRAFRPNKMILGGIFAVGVPAAIQNLLNVTGMTILNNLAAAFGSQAVAAIGIAQKINMIPMYIAMGLGQGVTPLVGYNYAAGNVQRTRGTYRFTLGAALAFLIVVAVIYQIFAGPLTGLFIADEVVVAYGAAFLRGMSLAIPFLLVDFLGVGVFNACGMGGYALLFAVLRKIVLEIPALLILNTLWPLYGLAYAQLFAEVILSVLSFILIRRLFRRMEQQAAEKSA